MRYAGNNTNLARESALTGSNMVASDAIYRTDTAAKQGGGRARVTGPYTGAADTDIDIEIVDNAGTTPQISAPAFSGVGNGTMTGIASSGIASQTITITLDDLGTETRKAYAPFQGVTLRAKAAGAPGNLITIVVDQSGLVRSPTEFALQEDLDKGANEYEGTHWDLSALGEMTLSAEGKIPTTAPRIVFGGDPQVYLAFRKYKEGRYVYGFSPAPVRQVARGSRIFAITGTRTLTITDGTSPETHTGVATLHDALRKIRDNSALVAVEGPVVDDRLPGGQGVVDLAVWTASYVVSVDPDGGYSTDNADLIVTPSTTAPTELLTIQCINADSTGQERWRVQGDVSGRLADAITNVLYAEAPYGFTIPLPQIPESTPGNSNGNMQLDYVPGNRGEGGQFPHITFHKPRLGAAAENGRYEFTWTPRPPEDCTEVGQVAGGPREDCLGVNPPGDEIVSDASRIIRVQRLTNAVRLVNESNTIPPTLHSANDITWINTSAKVLLDALNRLPGGVTSWQQWAADTAYTQDEVIEPSPRNGYKYAVQTYGGGTSHASTQPTWPTSIGATVTDNGMTWVCLGQTPYQLWDNLFEFWYTDAQLLLGLADESGLTLSVTWSDGVAAAAGHVYVPTSRNGCRYGVDGYPAYTSVSGQPTWPTTVGATVVEVGNDGIGDFDITWRCMEKYWTPTAGMAEGTIVTPYTGHRYRASNSGTTGGTEPTWADGVTDGSVVWDRLGGGLDIESPAAADLFYVGRYTSAATDVLAAAEISPDFDFASVDGDGCWQDPGDEGFWASTDGYLPWFNNLYGHSCRTFYDEDGEPYNATTREFGFGIAVGCPESLVYGDKIYLVISDVVGSSTGAGYQEGDTFNVRVNHALPVPFGGGQTGNDTLTWSVVLSDDGRIDDYALVTTAPAPYAYSESGDTLGFLITQGGIRFDLGDTFTVEIEGGRFKWRRDGGSWSSPIDIATTALADGLSAAFDGGTAPSWAAGDRWTYRAEASYGVVQVRTPLDGEFEWTTSTVIECAGGAINGVGLYRHRIPSDATILLEGSDDNFATSPLSTVIAWRRDNIWQSAVTNHAKYRISINRGGALRWLYLGPTTQLTIRNGRAELGRLTKRPRLPSSLASRGMGAVVDHTWLPQASTDALIAMLEHAAEFDDALIGIVPNDAEAETAMVRYESDSLDITDELGFQPSDPVHRRQSVSLALAAA